MLIAFDLLQALELHPFQCVRLSEGFKGGGACSTWVTLFVRYICTTGEAGTTRD